MRCGGGNCNPSANNWSSKHAGPPSRPRTHANARERKSLVDKPRPLRHRRQRADFVPAEHAIPYPRELCVRTVPNCCRHHSQQRHRPPAVAQVAREAEHGITSRRDDFGAGLGVRFDENQRVDITKFGASCQQGTGEYSLERRESHDAPRIVRERKLHGGVAIFAESVINQDRGGKRIAADGMGHTQKLVIIQSSSGCPRRSASLTGLPFPSMIRSLSDV